MRLEHNAAHILNEHIMATYTLQKVFSNLANAQLYKDNEEWDLAARQFYCILFPIPRGPKINVWP